MPTRHNIANHTSGQRNDCDYAQVKKKKRKRNKLFHSFAIDTCLGIDIAVDIVITLNKYIRMDADKGPCEKHTREIL